MLEIGLEILNIIYDNGYVGYIVGGFTRDMLLNIESNDIDITTNATPMELTNIFEDAIISSTIYGSVVLYYKNIRFDLTTFRLEDEYYDNRHPSSITYVNDLQTDLLRRDFTVNAICIDKDGQIIDLVGGKEDLQKHLLKTIGDSKLSFSRDALRILRAIRFSSMLDFTLSKDIEDAIKENKKLLKNISYNRKKNELDKIFGSNKAKEGIALIKKYHLEDDLELTHLERVKDYSDIVGIWAMINTDVYNFTGNEKELIHKINEVYEMDNLSPIVLYKYGVYVNLLAGINKGIRKKDILKKYEELPIKSREDILITAKEMCKLLKRKPGNFIGNIYISLEEKILKGELLNNPDDLKRYILENY